MEASRKPCTPYNKALALPSPESLMLSLPKYNYALILALLTQPACRTAASHSESSAVDDEGAPVEANFNLGLSESRDPGNCKIWSETVNDGIVAAYNTLTARSDYRFWYYLYHGVRNTSPSLPEDEHAQIETLVPAWKLPSTSIKGKGLNPVYAGEDYLYTHHLMIDEIRDILTEAGQPCIIGWESIPDSRSVAKPKDKALSEAYPVPASGTTPPKSDSGMSIMKSWEMKLQSPEFLKSITLGDLGYVLQHSIGNNANLRFSELNNKVGIRPRIAMRDDTSDESWAWNKVEYDLLSDTYSAPSNPIFWKLQGYIDSYIYRWLDANGYQEIALECRSRPGCYQWKGTWTGAKPPKSKAVAAWEEAKKPILDHKSEAFREAMNLLKIFHKSSRYDLGAIDSKTLIDAKDESRKSKILDPLLYSRDVNQEAK
jgi:hypothetical protein